MPEFTCFGRTDMRPERAGTRPLIAQRRGLFLSYMRAEVHSMGEGSCRVDGRASLGFPVTAVAVGPVSSLLRTRGPPEDLSWRLGRPGDGPTAQGWSFSPSASIATSFSILRALARAS